MSVCKKQSNNTKCVKIFADMQILIMEYEGGRVWRKPIVATYFQQPDDDSSDDYSNSRQNNTHNKKKNCYSDINCISIKIKA